ncbi:excalibur calcium-binding domain-containing protein [Kineococcus sp. G2]|uniref:excalibur calcium-binding domain-containing protein n=1 Tax=Kineococcus sp. G2 TaxID=3127484 RepID=UPI00301C3C2A
MGLRTWGRRGAAAALVVAGTGLLGAGPASAGLVGDRNCSDFPYQEDAQAWMDTRPGDPDGLDADGDGLACESLPHRPGTPVPAPAPTPVPDCLWGAIEERYAGTGGAGGSLGEVVQCQTPTPVVAGEYAHFQGGSIHSSERTGAQFTRGAIRDRWASTGWENGRLGFPTTSDTPTPNGRGWYTHFQGGSMYWSPATGAHFTAGAIRGEWASHGWENGRLGFPTTNDTPTPDGRGWYTHFQGGSVYWSPATGAHFTAGAIRGEWASHGWENGRLGFPATDDTPTPNGRGWYTHFQGGSVYWSPATDAHFTAGAIRGAWASHGWENGRLGVPATDDTPTPNGRGWYTHFQGGSVYWSPSTGAHTVAGAVRDAWAQQGWENGPLGFPVEDEHEGEQGRAVQQFQGGYITHDPAGGTRTTLAEWVPDE